MVVVTFGDSFLFWDLDRILQYFYSPFGLDLKEMFFMIFCSGNFFFDFYIF